MIEKDFKIEYNLLVITQYRIMVVIVTISNELIESLLFTKKYLQNSLNILLNCDERGIEKGYLNICSMPSIKIWTGGNIIGKHFPQDEFWYIKN